jgi:4-diphosphocytidyl-2-C-methyl-D-erythritol kinase
MNSVLTEQARAKVNLTLRILGKRPDGYHALVSHVVFAQEADTVHLDPARPRGLSVIGPMAGDLAGSADNLIGRAVELAAAAAPALRCGHITLEKHLPIAAGIGGGSADAAATLRLLQRANPQAPVDWMALASRLGADVPVCFANEAAVMTGIGETLVPLAEYLGPLRPMPAVLVNPMIAVPSNKTAAVFKALAAPPLETQEVARGATPVESRLDLVNGCNDLERAALQVMPQIAGVLAAMKAQPGVQAARLSGAGPTCFAIFDTLADAETAKSTLSAAHPSWWVRATHLT